MESLNCVNTKKCKKCNSFKDLSEFYKHNSSADGLLNECKDCTKNRVRSREIRLRGENPEWVLLEKKRLRDKYNSNKYVWVILSDYPNYSITDGGLIKNNKTNKIMKHYINSYGYVCVNLFDKNGLQKKPYLHRLLCETFIVNNNKTLSQVDHIDRNPLNNSLENLRWVSPKENIDNRGVFNKTGLFYNEENKKWCVQKKEYNNLINFGCFKTLNDAINKLTKIV